jgi:hypothetical protein
MEDELTIYRRAQRNRQQVLRDRLDDEKEAEVEGINLKYKEIENVEKMRLEQSKAQAKKSAEEISNAFKQTFSDRMQKDAIGTIMEVLNRISNLPKSQQMSVISDLFGDEARGLAPLIANIKELDRVLGMSNDKTKAAGSVLKEFLTRSDTTANSMQLLANRIEALQIAFGDSFLGSLDKLMKLGLGPIIDGLTWMIQNVPLLGPIIGVLSTAFIGLALAAPFIVSLITLLGQLGITATKIGAIWAGLQTVFIVAFQGILTWLGGTFIPAVLAFFSGPVGWTVLAIAAVVAMAIAFRKPLGDFLRWVSTSFTNAITNAWNAITTALPKAMQAAAGAIKAAFRGVLQWIARGINTVAGQINRLIAAYNRLPAPDIPLIPTLTVPAFAQGAVLNRPTLAMVGDGGEREYVIPESKMAAASSRFLAGQRGASVLPATTSSSSTTSAPQINITTGPVMQQQDGSRWVSIDDYERGLQQLAEQVLGTLRRPEARVALGWR